MYKLEIQNMVEKKMKLLNSNKLHNIILQNTGEKLDLKSERLICSNILKSITKSITFNFGKIENMDRLVKSHIEQTKNRKTEPLNTPYQNCCFEYDIDNDKDVKNTILITKNEIIPPEYILNRIKKSNNKTALLNGEIVETTEEIMYLQHQQSHTKPVTVLSWIKYDKIWKESPVVYMVTDDTITTFNQFGLNANHIYDLSYIMLLALTSLKLLTCKNIVQKEETIYKNKTIMKKGKLKQTKIPVEKYHVLEIAIPKSKRNTEYESSEETETTMPLHFCRGHFKTFTKEKPLLGKAVGTYWWQPSIRGDREKGVIEKDYNINLKGE